MTDGSNPYQTPSRSFEAAECVGRHSSRASWLAMMCPVWVQLICSCSCGHLPLVILPLSVGMVVLAAWPLARSECRTLVGALGFLAALALLTKQVADILWNGHAALLA